MVSVLVRDENFGNLFRLIASGFERVDVEFNAPAEENLRLIVNNLFGEIFGRAGVDEDNFPNRPARN